MNPRRKLIELALRMLGQPNLSWHSKMDMTHGVEMAAIVTLSDSHELAEITTAARRLYLEKD